jgi:hypothetical protein
MTTSLHPDPNATIASIGNFRQYYPFKGLKQTLKEKMPTAPEFKTKLKFDPSKLSTTILKQYLLDILHATEPDQLLAVDPPQQYSKDPDNLTNYRVLKELGLMSVKEWKMRLEKNSNDVEQLYSDDDMVAQDSQYYYESWKIIQEEVGNHEKQMSFFRLVSEIVRNLANRNYVEVDYVGDGTNPTPIADKEIEMKPMTVVVPKITITPSASFIEPKTSLVPPLPHVSSAMSYYGSQFPLPVELEKEEDEIQMESTLDLDKDLGTKEEDDDWLNNMMN